MPKTLSRIEMEGFELIYKKMAPNIDRATPTTTDTNCDTACRRRGRPIGKNRIPLSLTERRARNAQYERERRNKTSDAMAELAEAAGFDISISNGELLASVVSQLQRAAKRDPSEDIETLRQCNESLMQQIAELEQRLGWSDSEENKENLSEYPHNTKAEAFKQRNIQRRKIKRVPRRSNQQLREQEAFGIKLYSSSRESCPET